MNRKLQWLLMAVACLLGAAPALAEAQDVAERRERLEGLSTQEKEELRQKQESFVSLPEQEQARIRQLHEELNKSPDGQQLRGVLERYHAWLATLSSGERAELLSLPADKRLERIKAMIQSQEDARFRSEVQDKLTREDREAIVKWLLAFVDEHKAEILDSLPKDQLPPPDDRWPLMFVMLRGWGEGNLEMPRPKQTDIQDLINTLSPDAKEALTSVREPQKRMEVAQKWIGAAIASRRWRSPPAVSREELRKFYVDKLNASERERLEALAPEEMQRALQRMYFEHEFRARGPGIGPGGPGRGNGPGPFRGTRGPDDRRGEKKRDEPPPPPSD